MIDVHCKNCNRLILKATLLVAAIKCPRCGRIFEYQVFTNIHITNEYDPDETKKLLQTKSNIDITKPEA